MESTIYINTLTKVARRLATGIDLPKVSARQRAHLALTFKFFETDGEPALLASPTFRLVIKATPTGDPFAFTSSATAGTDDYLFEFDSLDAAALRTALGDLKQIEAWAEIEWTVAAVVERVAFPLTILAAYMAADEEAPDPVAEASVTWLTEQLASRITAAGYMEFQNADGDWFHLPLNSGRAPG